jgi:alkylation response protein AidB-like acyl-CoA dehydrogenase
VSQSAPPLCIDAARGLAPQIQDLSEEIEQSRRLPLPLVEAMARAGLFRLWVPRALGGEETDPMTLVRVEEISRVPPAGAWRSAASMACSAAISPTRCRTRNLWK